MKKTVYFIRHAQSKTNVDPYFEGEDTLSEKGSVQAASVAPRFRHLKVDGIYTSKILRARLTGEELGRVIGIEPVIYDFLGERRGTFSDKSTYSHTESFDELKARMESTRRLLEDEASPHCIVVVSHAIFLKSFAAYLMLGDSLSDGLLEKIEGSLMMDNTGVSKFTLDTETKKWRILSWNDIAHLAE